MERKLLLENMKYSLLEFKKLVGLPVKKREKLPGDRKVFFGYQLFSEHLLRSKSCCNLLLLGAESFSSELPTTSLNPLLLTI